MSTFLGWVGRVSPRDKRILLAHYIMEQIKSSDQVSICGHAIICNDLHSYADTGDEQHILKLIA